MHIHLDAVGGIAGDMFVAACLDTWPDHEAGAREAMHTAGLPTSWQVGVNRGHSKGLAGTRVSVTPPPNARQQPSGDYRSIRQSLDASELAAPVRSRALDIFARLAKAEAKAHGIPIDDVHFHEIADWDSVADIAAAAWLIDTLDATSWSIAPLPSGSGMVKTQHGMLPVPTPATALLLEGYPLFDDGIAGERVTPTGAAIVAHLEPRVGGPGSGVVGSSGHGLGTRDLPDRPNMLRLLTIQPVAGHQGRDSNQWLTGSVTVIEFEIDDQTSEDLAVGIDAVRETNGVIDVVQMAVTAKKGRLATQVRVLCHPEAKDTAIAACMSQTTTIGLRWRDEHRAELNRHTVTRAALVGKAVVRPGGITTAKPEIDAVVDVGSTAADRETARARFTVEDEHHE